MSSNNASAIPRRKWIGSSQRWRKQMEELAHMEDDQVTKVDGLTFVPDVKRFMILSTVKTEVLLGLWKDGTEIAIKKVRKAIFNEPEFQKELDILLKLRFNSRHIVQYVDSTQDKYFGYIAMQLCEYTIAEYIQETPAYPERKKRTKEFLKGLKDLHEGHGVIIIHRDIKPQNILIDTHGRARLADFGISRILDLEQSTMETGNAGTACWMATELLKNIQAGVKTRFKRSTDIQVAGMVVYYILSGGKHPFGDPALCHSNIINGKYTLDDLDDEQAKDLVRKMLNINPEQRPHITEALQHPFWEDSYLPQADSRKRQATSPIPNQVGGENKMMSGSQTQDVSTVTNSLNVVQLDVQSSMLPIEKLLEVLDDLTSKDLKRFRVYLSVNVLDGFRPIPRGKLENTDATDVSSIMLQMYGDEGAMKITLTILRKMKLNLLAEKINTETFLPTAASPIPDQVGGQNRKMSGSQTQEMRTVTESSLGTTNSLNAAQLDGQVPGSQTQEMRTVAESSLGTTNSSNAAQLDGQVPGTESQTQAMITMIDSNHRNVDGITCIRQRPFYD